MRFYVQNIVGYYPESNEFYTLAFVVIVAFLFVLYRIYSWLKRRSSHEKLYDSDLYTMHNYTFNFQHAEAAAIASEKKIGVFTKTVLWGLILFFVVTPMYEIITLLEPINYWSYGFMDCFSGLR